jgi:hypothetical protein
MRVAPSRGGPIQSELVKGRALVGGPYADGEVGAELPIRERREFVAVEQEARAAGETQVQLDRLLKLFGRTREGQVA